jgi:multiple sugar transport system permease protein
MADQQTVLPGDRLLAYVALAPAAALLILLVAVPTISVLVTSFQDVGLGGEARFVGIDNFVWAVTNVQFLETLRNTFVWVFGSVSLEMAVGLGLALLLHKQFMFRGLARAIILAPYLIPTVVAVLTWRFMFHDIMGVINYALRTIGLIDQPLLFLNSASTAMMSVIVVGVWKFFPFVVIALLGILQSIPQEQYEAARIDGASAFQQFWRITLPHILPVFLLTALLRTIWAFHKFEIIYLLTGGGPVNATTTLPVLVYFKGFVDFEFGRAAAAAIITFLIILVFLIAYFFGMKQVEKHQ